LAVVCVVWGTTYLAIRIGLETIPPGLLGGLRYTAAGVMLAAVLRLRGHRLPWQQWPAQALAGSLTIFIGNGGVIWAEQWVPSGVAAVMVATVPFWMLGVEMCFQDGERPSPRLLTGLLVGFAGIVVLVWPDITGSSGASRGYIVGIIALQVACLGWSVGSVLSRRFAGRGGALAMAAMQMFFGGLFMLVAGTLRGEWTQLTWSSRTVVAELYLTFIGSILGYSAYTIALARLPSATVSLYAYANPVIAVLLGALLLAEPLGSRVLGATAMVLVGSAIVQSRRMRAGSPSSVRGALATNGSNEAT